jgi:hypothetical protein
VTDIGARGVPVFADLDGDGHPDLVYPDPDAHRIVIRRGDGTGHFGPPRYVPVPDLTHPTRPPCSDCPQVRDVPEQLAVADLNRDGHLDLLATTGAGDAVAVLLSDGHGAFKEPRRYPMGGARGPIVVGDLTRNGPPNVVVGDALLVNDGHGGLLAPRKLPGGGAATALGDLDRDGHLDVVMQGPDRLGDGGPVWALLNDGHRNFTVAPGAPRPTPADAPAAAPAQIALADIDGDGFLDVVKAVPHAGESGELQLRHGEGHGRFGPPVVLNTGGLRPTGVAVGDLDGDGRPDLLVANRATDDLALLVAIGGGNFASPILFPTEGSNTLRVFLTEINGDGLPDLAVLDENPEKPNSTNVSVRLAIPAPEPTRARDVGRLRERSKPGPSPSGGDPSEPVNRC